MVCYDLLSVIDRHIMRVTGILWKLQENLGMTGKLCDGRQVMGLAGRLWD